VAAIDAGAGYVSCRGVSKQFDDVTAVDSLDLDVAEGEFFSMLGPSGSGKTTVLRMIAGFENPTAGRIFIDGEDITDVPPFDRTVNTVFQDYALFPHMTIQENVEYGLRTRKVPKPERAKQALEAIERVQLGHVATRLPHQLSGGQRQRIALARALVLRPKVLLLDEPLGALDKQLREQMQVELKTIQREAGITFIFVTHDQEEAMRMSDRIAVFNKGRIEQIGTPEETYESPATAFVAGFLGVSNLLKEEDAEALFGSRQLVNIRPERIKIHPENYKASAGEIAATGVISERAYTGASTLFFVDTDKGPRLTVSRANEESGVGESFALGQRVSVTWRENQVALIPN
jgi:putative spermidine/putrescine transport system ATP-binding protein